MPEKKIYITAFDMERLEKVLDETPRDQVDLDRLEEEMNRCEVVDSRSIPADVVTLNSQVRLRDLKSAKEMVVTLVFLRGANMAAGRLSMASPIGTAILGYRAGDEIEWEVPSGTKRVRIEEVLYQPEAAGDYHM